MKTNVTIQLYSSNLQSREGIGIKEREKRRSRENQVRQRALRSRERERKRERERYSERVAAKRENERQT